MTDIVTPSKRKSELSKRFRINNEEDRRALKEKILNARIEALENDNEFQSTADSMADDDADDDYQDEEDDLVYSTPVNKRKRNREREKKRFEKKSLNINFKDVLEKSYLETYPENVPTYLTAASKPSPLPARNFCSICGYLSTYTCKQCSSKYCSIKCFNNHVEYRCKRSLY